MSYCPSVNWIYAEGTISRFHKGVWQMPPSSCLFENFYNWHHAACFENSEIGTCYLFVQFWNWHLAACWKFLNWHQAACLENSEIGIKLSDWKILKLAHATYLYNSEGTISRFHKGVWQMPPSSCLLKIPELASSCLFGKFWNWHYAVWLKNSEIGIKLLTPIIIMFTQWEIRIENED